MFYFAGDLADRRGESPTKTLHYQPCLGTFDGGSLLFSSNRAGSHSLWRVAAAGGAPERLASVGQNASDPVFSKDGKRRVLAVLHGRQHLAHGNRDRRRKTAYRFDSV